MHEPERVVWNIANIKKVGSYTNSTALGSDAYDLETSADGYKIYVTKKVARNVVTLNLTDEWNVANITSYATSAVFFSNTSARLRGITLDETGEYMYLADTSTTGGGPIIREYYLSTAWLVSSYTYNAQNYNFVPDIRRGLTSTDDKYRFYAAGSTNYDYVWQYNMSSPRDVTSYDNNDHLDMGTYEIRGLAMSKDGKHLYTAYYDTNLSKTMLKHTVLTVAHEVDSGVESTETSDILNADVGSTVAGIAVDKNRGRFLYAVQADGNTVYQYALG